MHKMKISHGLPIPLNISNICRPSGLVDSSSNKPGMDEIESVGLKSKRVIKVVKLRFSISLVLLHTLHRFAGGFLSSWSDENKWKRVMTKVALKIFLTQCTS